MRVLYTAAHGGFEREGVPLGGGAAVAGMLTAEWSRTRPFDFRLITPAVLGRGAPTGADLVAFEERKYAAFCEAFSRAATEEILCEDPRETVVLVNDISEGIDFRRVAEAGFRIHTIYHVDVVAYVARIYARGWVSPERLVRWWPRLRPVLPRLTRLIFEQQEHSLLYSRSVIVPSAGMKEILVRCYPAIPRERIVVLAWGSPPLEPACAFPVEFEIPDGACVLLTLSRISPEKGQDRLIEAFIEWEARGDFPSVPLVLFVCGGAAYMMGERYLARLRELAGKLRRVRVYFPGHVTGPLKTAFYKRADIYVFASRHESYGLTLEEAQSAGLASVCFESDGVREVLTPETGYLVRTREELRAALGRLIGDGGLRASMGAAARRRADARPFARAAERLQTILADAIPGRS